MSDPRTDPASPSTHATWCARASNLLPQLSDEEAIELRIAMLSGTTQRLAALVRRCSTTAHWASPGSEDADEPRTAPETTTSIRRSDLETAQTGS